MNRTLLSVLLLAAVAGGLYWWGYDSGHDAMQERYSALEAKMEYQQDSASALLAKLTKERDEKQAALDRLAVEQEKLDVEAKIEIARLVGELERRPVRVRVQQARECGSGPGSGGAGDPRDSAPDAGQAYRLLPEENSRRLREALSEIETLSAAYNSCKASLINLSGY